MWSFDSFYVLILIYFKINSLDFSCSMNRTNYQTTHLSSGFIGDPTGQLKSSENSLILDNGAITLKRWGEWESVKMIFFSLSFRWLPHQFWKSKNMECQQKNYALR